MSTDAADAIREILADPALPVTALLDGISGHPGVDAERIIALREAHDYLVSRRLARSPALLEEVRGIDPALASTLRWHITLVSYLSGLPPSRPRNAVLGDVHRGDLLTWADAVVTWQWNADASRADGLLEVAEFPGLYDSILLWDNQSRSVFVLPTHRDGISWTPGDSGWLVRVDNAYLHGDELIVTDDPRDHPDF